ncbi:hypothetical protein O181_121795 [Austropuccinia psidii MF-1]|uniref:Integrase catalytic domain-containing protein n=1 Tax=Austropuccinia psidii MF-1 TaxID=1389203 RepID=A0A9Q3Q2M8_9BASI|nr:hypothetical protein [Austropuccinia psidii MF-1]
MDWVTGITPGGDRAYNACLETFDIFSKTPIFLPSHKDDTAMEIALLIWNREISWTGIFTNIISNRDPILTSVLWANINELFGAKLSFSTAYHSQTDGMAERIIPILEDMVRRFSLELEYKTSIHASTNKTPAILEKGWNSKLPQDLLRKNLVEIPDTAGSFKGILDKARKHSIRWMEDSSAYTKDKWDKSYATPDFKVGDLVLVSTTNLNKIKGCKNLKDSFEGPFLTKYLHGENAIAVELSQELSNKHPTFPVSLVKPDKSSDSEKFPLRKKVPQHISPI